MAGALLGLGKFDQALLYGRYAIGAEPTNSETLALFKIILHKVSPRMAWKCVWLLFLDRLKFGIGINPLPNAG